MFSLAGLGRISLSPAELCIQKYIVLVWTYSTSRLHEQTAILQPAYLSDAAILELTSSMGTSEAEKVLDQCKGKSTV